MNIVKFSSNATANTVVTGTGGVDADRVAEKVYKQIVNLSVSMVSPVLFAALLAFDHWGWNRGMFFMLDRLDHQACGGWRW